MLRLIVKGSVVNLKQKEIMDLQFVARDFREFIRLWQKGPTSFDRLVNLQQGLRCANCRNNFRSITLAAAVIGAFSFKGCFEDFCRANSQIRCLTVIEVNAAGTLTPYLQLLPRQVLHASPRDRSPVPEFCGRFNRCYHPFRYARRRAHD
jgi:hypothetical protein